MELANFFVPKTKANALRQLKSLYPDDLDSFKGMGLKQMQAIIIKTRKKRRI